jgi:xanthine dehydrogenase YagS FAD-binding subunit
MAAYRPKSIIIMRPFKFTPGKDVANAIQFRAANTNASFLAGGTNLLDLMKEDVARPDELIDLSSFSAAVLADSHSQSSTSGLSISAWAKNTQTANHPEIRKSYPLLTQAILAGASAQIRNMASNGGNLLQRTRCSYFYDTAMPCNKRVPGSGCSAREGINRMHAIFGCSEHCVAVFPSDMAVALSALEASVGITTKEGQTLSIPFDQFHRLPGDHPEKDNNLPEGAVITHISLPQNNFADHSAYLKVRDRSSYAFALVSVAAALEIKDERIVKARIAMGGVAHKPWRATRAENILKGKKATLANFERAAALEMKAAKPLEHNKFKIEMGKNTIVRSLEMALNTSNI